MADDMTADADETAPTAPPPSDTPAAVEAPPRTDIYFKIRRAAPVLVVVFCAGLLVIMALLRPFNDPAADPELRDAFVGFSETDGATTIDDPAAAYVVIDNTGGSDTLLSASTPAAERTMLQELEGASDTSPGHLVTVDELPIEGYQETRLQPGSDQLLLSGLRPGLAVGDTVEITLDFERAGTVTVEAEVQTYAEIGERLLPPRLEVPTGQSPTPSSEVPPE
jgi:copper(I)-binding protein